MKYFNTNFPDVMLGEFPGITTLPDLDIESEKSIPFMSCLLSELLGKRSFGISDTLDYLEKIKSGIPRKSGTLFINLSGQSDLPRLDSEILDLDFHSVSVSLHDLEGAQEKFGIQKVQGITDLNFDILWKSLLTKEPGISINSRSLIYLALVYTLNSETYGNNYRVFSK